MYGCLVGFIPRTALHLWGQFSVRLALDLFLAPGRPTIRPGCIRARGQTAQALDFLHAALGGSAQACKKPYPNLAYRFELGRRFRFRPIEQLVEDIPLPGSIAEFSDRVANFRQRQVMHRAG